MLYSYFFLTPVLSVVLKPAVAAASESLVEMQILHPFSDLVNQNLWDGARNQCFNKLTRWFLFMLKSEKDWSRAEVSKLSLWKASE